MWPFLFEALVISTRYPPPFPVRIVSHLDVACPRPRPPASAARPFAPRRMPASAAVPVPVRSPLCRPWPAPRYLSSPGGFSRSGSLLISVSLPHPPRVPLQLLASSSFGVLVGWIFTKKRSAKAPPLPDSHAPWSSPPATWPCRRRSGYPDPPLPTPLVFMIPYLLV